MGSPISADDEKILLVTHHDNDRDDDNDYNNYNTPNTSRVDETTFTMSSSTGKQPT